MAQDKTHIVILGAGGTALEIVETVLWANNTAAGPLLSIVGFLDDNERLWGTYIDGYPVLGPLSAATQYANCRFVNAIGSSRNWYKRQVIIAHLGIPNDRFVNVIHPTATISKTAMLGRGIVALQHSTVGSHVQIGNHVTILANAVVNHHSLVGDNCCICSGVCVSGNVSVGNNCYIGTGAVIRDRVVVGENAFVGMGSVVVSDIEPNTVVCGNPARVLRRNYELQ